MFLRYPAVCSKPEKFLLFFISDETIWRLEAESFESMQVGKYVIVRHLFSQGPVADLHISDDGKWLVFTGSIEKGLDVYAMPTEGGNPKRLTFLNSGSLRVTGINNNKVGFISSHECPARFGMSKAYSIGLPDHSKKNEKEIQSLEYGSLSWFALSDKKVVIQVNGYGYGSWKGYKGGNVGEIWEKKAKSFDKITSSSYNCIQPVYCDGQIFYLSDEHGTGNLYSIDGQLTTYNDYYVQDLNKAGSCLFFSKGGRLFRYDAISKKSEQLQIEFQAHTPQTYPRLGFNDDIYSADYTHTLSSFSLDKQGKNLALTLRGQAFSMPLYVVNAQRIAGFGYNLIDFLGEDFICVETGLQEKIHILSRDGKTKRTIDQLEDGADLAHIEAIYPSPCGKKFAFKNTRNQLILVNGKKIHELRKPSQAVGLSLDWSPDGRYLAYAGRQQGGSSAVFGITTLDTKTHTFHALPTEMRDTNPVFDESGKYLYFLSNRSMHTSFDDVRTQLNFQHTIKPYVFCLQKNAPNPFRAWIEEINKTEKKDDTETDEQAKQNSKEQAKPEIEFDGIEKRCYTFPGKPGEFLGIYSTANGLMFLEDTSFFETFKKGSTKGYRLSKFDFQTSKMEVLHEDVHGVALSGDKQTMALLMSENIQICEAAKQACSKEIPWKASGVISWDRIPIKVDQKQEFKLIFQQAFAFMKEQFKSPYNPKLDWQNIYDKYEALLPLVHCRVELNYVIREMQGELGTSHAYVIKSGDVRLLPENNQGYLGGKFSKVKEGYKIESIFEGRAWSDKPIEISPLMQCEVGDIITQVDGICLKQVSLEEALTDKAGSIVELGLLKKDKVFVKPISTEVFLHYIDWVNKNKQFVENATEGKVGYVHIPDMDVRGYVQFCRDYYQQYHKQGLIVDFRFNGGGYVSPMILDVLSRRLTGSVETKYEKVCEPSEACSGKLVFLCNESSGSDGDIFAYHVKKLGLGKLIGKRTWGGVVGICVRNYFIDGGLASQPEYSICFNEGPIIENRGVAPDVVIENTPNDTIAGTDRQLEYALQEMKSLLNGKMG